MKTYFEKRITDLQKQQGKVNADMDKMEKDSHVYNIHQKLLHELTIRRTEIEEALDYCKENRKPILIDIESSMFTIENYLKSIDVEFNSDSKYYKSCQIAHDALLQLRVLKIND